MASLVRRIQTSASHYLGRGSKLGVKNPRLPGRNKTPKALRRSSKTIAWLKKRHTSKEA